MFSPGDVTATVWQNRSDSAENAGPRVTINIFPHTSDTKKVMPSAREFKAGPGYIQLAMLKDLSANYASSSSSHVGNQSGHTHICFAVNENVAGAVLDWLDKTGIPIEYRDNLSRRDIASDVALPEHVSVQSAQDYFSKLLENSIDEAPDSQGTKPGTKKHRRR